MNLGYPLHGLRVTVRLNDSVVSQRVVWAPPVAELLSLALLSGLVAFIMSLLAANNVVLMGVWSPLMSQLAVVLLVPTGMVLALVGLLWPRQVDLGANGGDAVPTPDGLPLGRVLWAPGRDPVFIDHTDGDQRRSMDAHARWSWSAGDVHVDVSAQHREHARRLPTDPLGDMGLVVVALALYVGMMQARIFVEVMPGQTTIGADDYQLSPELIARLLERDLDGEDQALPERADRPEFDRQGPGVYLPAGNDGTMARAGGGANQGPQVVRTPPPEDITAPLADQLPQEGEDSLALQPDPEEQDLEAPQPSRPEALDLVADSADDHALATRPRDPMERFIGWGFRDWFDSAARQDKIDPRVERQLHMARARLRLDPDDYGALQVVGHYAYLAENIELCRTSYERISELYPEDSAAHNNLALTYKREGNWTREEELYRKALALDPMDPIVLNNLAVNLAHQERFEEALGIMKLLEELDPDDPYSDLHRAKVYAAMGKREKAYKYLKRALDGIEQLDTLHHIEFRQDLRLEPLLSELREDTRFERLLRRAYGPDADAVLQGPTGGDRG